MTLTPEASIALFNIFAPIVTGIIKDYRASHGDKMPTDAEVVAQFTSNIDRYLAEGAAWRKTHPKA